MDFNTILGWSVSVLAVAGLVIFLWVRKKNRDKRTLAVLHAFARENNSEISSYDSWDKSLIGLDNRDTNRLFFIRKLPEREVREVISLSEVAECRMSKAERRVNYNKETVNVIDRIELIISFYDHKPEIVLEFYNVDYDDLTLTGELQIAQKWMEMIRSIVKTNRERRASEKKKVSVRPLINQPVANVQGDSNRKKAKKESLKKIA